MTERQIILLVSGIGILPAVIHGVFGPLPTYAWCMLVVSAACVTVEACIAELDRIEKDGS